MNVVNLLGACTSSSSTADSGICALSSDNSGYAFDNVNQSSELNDVSKSQEDEPHQPEWSLNYQSDNNAETNRSTKISPFRPTTWSVGRFKSLAEWITLWAKRFFTVIWLPETSFWRTMASSKWPILAWLVNSTTTTITRNSSQSVSIVLINILSLY